MDISSTLGLIAAGVAVSVGLLGWRRLRHRRVAEAPVPYVRPREAILLDEVRFELPFDEYDQPYRIELPEGVTPLPATDEPLFHGPFERLTSLLARRRMSAAEATDVALQLCADVEARIEAGDPILSGRPDTLEITVATDGDAIRCRWSPERVVESEPAGDDVSASSATYLLRPRPRNYASHDDPRADHGGVITAIARVWLECATGTTRAASPGQPTQEAICAPSVERVIFGALLSSTQRYRPRTVRDLARALWLTARDHQLALTTRAFEGTPMLSPAPSGYNTLAPLFPDERRGFGFHHPRSPATEMFWPGDSIRYEASRDVPPPGINAGVASWKIRCRYGVPIAQEVDGIH